MKRLRYIIYIIMIATTLCSCDNYEKLLKSTDYEAKFKAAMDYYNDHSYRKAKDLLENMILYYRGREHAEDVFSTSRLLCMTCHECATQSWCSSGLPGSWHTKNTY